MGASYFANKIFGCDILGASYFAAKIFGRCEIGAVNLDAGGALALAGGSMITSGRASTVTSGTAGCTVGVVADGPLLFETTADGPSRFEPGGAGTVVITVTLFVPAVGCAPEGRALPVRGGAPEPGARLNARWPDPPQFRWRRKSTAGFQPIPSAGPRGWRRVVVRPHASATGMPGAMPVGHLVKTVGHVELAGVDGSMCRVGVAYLVQNPV